MPPKIDIATLYTCKALKVNLQQEMEGDKKSPSSSEFSQFDHQKSL